MIMVRSCDKDHVTGGKGEYGELNGDIEIRSTIRPVYAIKYAFNAIHPAIYPHYFVGENTDKRRKFCLPYISEKRCLVRI